MTPEKRETAIKWLTEEVRSLRMAPKINGCGPENWADQLEIMETCLEAVRECDQNATEMRPGCNLGEPLTLEQLRSYRVETDLASWHPEICDRAADCITDLMARCDRLEEARENANEACAKWETLCHMAEQERDQYKAALQNWHEEG